MIMPNIENDVNLVAWSKPNLLYSEKDKPLLKLKP